MNKGAHGQMGIGGEGGHGAFDGNSLRNTYKKCTWLLQESLLMDVVLHANGIRGANGTNGRGIKTPDLVPFLDPFNGLVEYKNYFEEFIANGIPVADSIRFLNDLIHNEKIRSLHDTNV